MGSNGCNCQPVLRFLPLTAKTAPSDKAEVLPMVHPGRGCGCEASQGQVLDVLPGEIEWLLYS